jgi:ribose-phosphate pyrophosphokinase
VKETAGAIVLYAIPVQRRLADALRQLTGLEEGGSAIGRFPNGELHVDLDMAPADRDCVVLGAVAPPDEHLLSTLLLCHTLKKEGARRITALLPYLGYARHDRAEPRKSRAAAWLGEIVRASGVNAVVAVDVHSSLIHELFPIPVLSLFPTPLFAAEIGKLALTDPVIVAPDEGALERCEAVRRAAGIGRPLAHFTKTRTPEGVKHSILHGVVGREVILVDDILDTGATLVSAADTLQRAGARQIVVMATYGLFTGTAWERLWSLGGDTRVLRGHDADSGGSAVEANLGPSGGAPARQLPGAAPRRRLSRASWPGGAAMPTHWDTAASVSLCPTRPSSRIARKPPWHRA